MALKTLMLRRSIEMKEADLAKLQERSSEFEAREAELTAAIDELADDAGAEERSAVEEMVAEFDEQRSAHDASVQALADEIEQLRSELSELEASSTPPAAPQRAAEHKKERMIPTMNTAVNIRSLPTSQRAWEAAYTIEQRTAICAQAEMQDFFRELRALGASKRAVTGAELTIPVVLLELIAENQYRYSKLMNRVRVVNVQGEARQTIAGLVPPAVWTECCAAINELTFNFGQWPMNCWKVAGFVTICNSQLNDSDINLAGALVEMISMSIGISKDMAILYGTGSGMPLGIVTRLAQQSQPAGYPATAPEWIDLHTTNILTIDGTTLSGAAFWGALNEAVGATFTRYSRGEQFWAMNSKTYNYLRGKAIATSVTGEWVALIGGTLPIVSGDIDVLEFIPDYDVIGGYGDLYLWAQREGATIGMDDVGFTNRVKDQTLFFGKERADGAPIIPGAFVAFNVHNTSVTTSITFPSDTANDAALQGLTVGALTLSPTFDADVLTYTASAANNVSSAVVTATPEQVDAGISITVTSGTTTKVVTNGSAAALAVGANTITITVGKGNNTRVYTVTVTRAAS